MFLETIFIVLIFLFSVILHEISHGEMARVLGDPTAEISGRLSLNPIRHLDLFGSIILPGFLLILRYLSPAKEGIIFGWAKPVPINPYNFKNPEKDSAKVAIAGPLSNFFLALFFSVLIRILPSTVFFKNLKEIFALIVWINLTLALFNLVPIPPLDGSFLLFAFLPPTFERFKFFLQNYGPFLLILFLFFGFQYLVILVDFLFRVLVG
jgi:Zn-dependent protease